MKKEELKKLIKPETEEMLNKKREFLLSVEAMLLADEENNMVDRLVYQLNIQDEETYDEFIDIIYKDGHTRRLLITGNSNYANTKAILDAVYG